MRPIKELLILLRDYIIAHGVETGMCKIIMFHDIDINSEEEDALFLYLYENNIGDQINPLNNYWWKVGLSEPRIEWLNEQIEKL